MGEAKRRIKADGGYIAEGDAVDVAVAMFDIEARKDLPEEARASAQFCRLMGPMIVEACDSIAKRHDAALVMVSLGYWLGELMISTLGPNMEDFGVPPAMMARIVAINVLEFERAAFAAFDEFEKARGREPQKVSFPR